MNVKRILLAILCSVILILSAACGGQATQQPVTEVPTDVATEEVSTAIPAPVIRDVLTIAINSEPNTLYPYGHDMTNIFLITSLTYEKLVEKDASGDFQPNLATEWEWLDESTIQFKLRDDVYFHDGSKMTAEDVKFSLGLMAASSFTKNFFGVVDIENTEVVDPQTIIVRLTAPFAPFLDALASWRGVIISKAAYESMGEEAFGRQPVGSGPLMFNQWVTGDHLEFTTFDMYWGETLTYKSLVARIIVEGSSRTAELETGGVDIAMDIPITDRQRIADNPDMKLLSGEGLRFEYVMINNDFEINKDIRIRKAMAYAIDVPALVETVWRGEATVADSFMPPSVLGYKAVGPYPYDPEESKRLLTDAGYPTGFEFDLFAWENEINPVIVEILQSMWAAVGIKANVQILDLTSWVGLFNNGELQVLNVGSTSAITDPVAALLIWPTWRTISLRHNDPVIQEYLDTGVTIYDRAERIAHYEEMMQYLYDQTFVIPLAYPKFAFGTQADILNMTFSPDNIPDLSIIEFAE